MARTLGRLVVQIGASTSLFERELQNAGKAVKTWGNGVTRNVNRTVARIDDRMSKLAKSIDRGFGDLGGSVNRAVNNIKIIGPALKVAGVAAGAFVASFAAIGGIAAAFTRLTEEVDLFAKTADRLGVSTQFLKGIELGASQAGINFNQLNDNLRQFTTNLFSATAGSGRFSETIEKLGFDLDELIQTDADERLKLVAQSISEIDDASERASTAVALFGESGRDLVTLFAGGAAGLEGFVAQAERLGIAFDRQTLASIENARDAIGEIGLIVESVSLRFLAAFAPLFETLADFWIQAGLTSQGVQGAMDAMANGVAFAIHVIDNTVALGFRVWFELKAVVLDAAAAITNAWAAVADALAQTFNNIISNLNRMISVVALGVRQLVNSVATAIDALPGVNAPGRANFAIPQIPNVGFSGAGARIAAQNFSGGADLARGIAGGFGSDFNQQFQANRLRVPAPPTRARGVLPPPPPPDGGGGGGGGRSGGGRSGAGGGAANVGKIDVDGKKRQQAEQLGKAFVKLQEDIEKLGRSFDRTLESTELNNEVERERLRLLQAGETDIDRRVNQFKDLRDAENQLAEAQAELDALLADNAIATSAAAAAQMELTQGYEDYVAAIEESFALDRQQERLQTINTLNEDLNSRLSDLLETEREILGIRTEATAVETLLMELKELDVELTDKQTATLVKQAAVLDLTAERVGNLEQQYNLLNETSSIIQTNTAQLFQGLLTGTETVGSAFNKFFDNLFSQLLQLSINTLFQSIFGGGIGGGLFGGGGLLGGLFGFQEGGTVPQTGPYLLHAGERVLNPREARGGMGGGDIIINNMTGASVTARRTQGGGAEIDIQEAVRQSREAVRNDFVRSIATGYGDYANAVQSSFQVTRRL